MQYKFYSISLLVLVLMVILYNNSNSIGSGLGLSKILLSNISVTSRANLVTTSYRQADTTGKSSLSSITNSTSVNADLYPDCASVTEAQFWAVIERRKNHIRRMCEVYKGDRNVFRWQIDWDIFRKTPHDECREGLWYSELLVFDKLKLLFQGIQKAGTTNVISYINNYDSLKRNYSYGELGRKGGYQSPHGLAKTTISYQNMYGIGLISSVEEAKAKFESYYKIIFFREPLERILSSYSFLFGPNSTHTFLLPGMIKKARGIQKPAMKITKEVQTGKIEGITVTEYLQSILDKNNSWWINKHFRPQMINAMPCDIQFNFIGNTKDLSCEMKFLMKKLTGEYPNVVPPVKSSKPEKKKPTDLLSGVSPDLIRKVLLKHYKIDYDFLDYPFPQF